MREEITREDYVSKHIGQELTSMNSKGSKSAAHYSSKSKEKSHSSDHQEGRFKGLNHIHYIIKNVIRKSFPRANSHDVGGASSRPST